MAEVGLIGTIVGIASAGIKLSITLYLFSETESTAHVEIKDIVKDVSLNSAVLEELAARLRQDDQARLYSSSALHTAEEVVTECEAVFNDINSAMGKAIDCASKRGSKKGRLVLSATEKLKWPFLQPKMEKLRGNLEKLKSTLVLMLHVLNYARALRAEKEESPKQDDSYQMLLLDSLLRVNDRDKQGQSRSLEPAAPALSEGASSTETPFLSLATLGILSESLNSTTIVEGNAVQESHVESTVKACITDIENALLKFEQSHITMQAQPQVTVQIEVQKKNITADRDAQRLFNPWKFISITQKREMAWGSTANGSSPGTSSFGFGTTPVSLPIADHSSISTGTTVNPHKDRRTAASEAEFEEVASILRENTNHALEKGERLGSQNRLLQDGCEHFAVQAQLFRRGANRTRAERPWYATAWNSLPSTSYIVNPIWRSLPSPTTIMTYFWETLQTKSYPKSLMNDAFMAPQLKTSITARAAFAEAKRRELALQRKARVITQHQDAHPPFSPNLDWGGDGNDGDNDDDERDSVHKLLTEWTTLFDQ